MSTWTSRVLLLAAALGLAACDGGFNISRNAPQAIRLGDGLVVEGARGWCIDDRTTKPASDPAVVVLGSCAAIGRNALAPRPKVPGVVTVLVDGDTSGAPPVTLLERFFRSDAGRATLARDGDAKSVKILETRRVGDALMIHARDDSAGAPDETSNDYWRALFGVNGRFVSVSLVGLADRPMDRSAGLATLEAQVKSLKAANPG